MRAAPSQEEVRRQNLGALLRYVHRHGATSRAELTARLGLNRSTIGALTADLATASLVVEEAGRGETKRAGRPSLVVSPRSDTVYVHAISIEIDQVRAARVGLGGLILDQRVASRVPGEDATKQLAATVAELHAATPTGTRSIGTGIAACGRFREADGGVRLAPPATAPGLPGGAVLADPVSVGGSVALPDPVSVGASADLAALAEHSRGVAAGCDNLIYLYGDGGITAGIIAGGRRVSGYGGAAGEVGHMVVRPAGLPCGCGSHGCWETEVGERALLRAAGRTNPAGGGAAAGGYGREAVRAVVDAASRGDSVARDAVRQVGDWLGYGVGNLVNIFNPEMVVFGEALRDVFLVAAAPLRSRLNSVGLPGSLAHLRLRTPALGDEAPLIGAAELAFEPLLADPLSYPG